MDGFLHFLMLREMLIVFPWLKLNITFSKAIIEWNKLDPAIRNVKSLGIFKSNIFKFFRPTPRSFFNCYNHKEIRLMARLRLGLSHLREQKFNRNFQNCINPLCSCVWISNQRLTFFSTVPYLMIKESLPWTL